MFPAAAAGAKAGRSAEPDSAQPDAEGLPQQAAESEAPSEAPSARPPLQPLTQSRQRGGSAAMADRARPGGQIPTPQHSGRDSRASSPSSHLQVPKREPPQLKQSPGQLRTCDAQPHEQLSPEPSNAPAGQPRQPRGTAGSAAGSEPVLQHHGGSKQLSASTAANATARSRKLDAVVQDDASSPPAGQMLSRSAAEAARDAAAREASPPSRAAAPQADVPGVQVAADDTSPAVMREASFAVPIGCQR